MLSEEEISQYLAWDKEYLLPVVDRNKNFKSVLIVDGKGCYIWDAHGNKYLDFFAQTWNVNIGHKNPKVIDAIKRQAEELPYVSPTRATVVRSKLLRKLVGILPGGLSKIGFYNGGSEAVEAALKIAKESTGKSKIISRWYAYHGATAGAQSAMGIAQRKTQDEPLVPGCVLVPAPYCYRCKFGLQYHDCKIRCVEFLEETIKFEDSQKVAAVIAEPVQGAGGVIVPPPEYWPKLRELTRKHQVLLIADEVITGFGRTGTWFGVQQWDVEPDIMTMAKGISSGYLPLSAVATTRDVARYYENEPMMHFATYQSHTLCLAAALANIEVIEEERLIENSKNVGRYLKDQLKALQDRHKIIGETRCLGLLAAIELVKNRETKEPFIDEDAFFFYRKYRPEDLVAEVVASKAFKKGLIVSAFKSSSTVKLCPPLCITEQEVDKAISIMDEILSEVDLLCT